jgi:hypothetical protein
MRLKTASKYIFSEMKNSVLIFYLAILLLIVFLAVSVSGVKGSISGMEMTSSIFLFILGLNSFKKNYLFLISNGVPRRTQFKSFFLAAMPIAAGMAVIDSALGIIFNRISNFNSLFNMIILIEHKYRKYIYFLLWSIALYMCAITLGYFITLAYYRMNKIQKICISIGVPVFFTMVLPYILYNFCSTTTVNWVYNGITTMFGVTGSYGPISAVVVFLVSTVLLSALSYLLIRKAPVKDN